MKVVTIRDVVYRVGKDYAEVTGYVGTAKTIESLECEIDSIKMISFDFRSLASSFIEKIVIPDSVENFDDAAFFNCQSLREVVFGEASELGNIGFRCFEGCENLSSFVCPPRVKVLESFAFSNCKSLKSFVMKRCSDESEIRIDFGCFSGCSSLQEFLCPRNHVYIAERAFSGCTALRTVTFDRYCKVTASPGLFQDCRLENFQFTNNLVTDQFPLEGIVSAETAEFIRKGDFILDSKGTKLLKYCGSSSDVLIPPSVEVIRRGSFDRNSSVRRIFADEDSRLSVIEEGAFYGSSLESVCLPRSVVKVKGMNPAFDVSISIENPHLICDGDVILSSDSRILYHYIGRLSSVTIPDFITKISSFCFCRNSSLLEIHFEDGSMVEELGKYAFSETGLCEISIPSSVRKIGSHCFSFSKRLSSVSFDSGSELETIMEFAFVNCSSLCEIEFPSSLKNIRTNAFAHCDSLSSIVIP